MLKMLFIVALGLITTTGRSQSILDLTEQLAFDAEKLASLKSTLQDLYQGYAELKAGYTRIRDVARDNFNLHKAFLDALWVLSPAVRNDPRMSTLPVTADRLLTEYRVGVARIAGNAVFTAQELAYITGTLNVVLARCNQAVEEFAMVTTDDALRMSDAQRLAALDWIDAEIRSELAFLQQFNNTLAVETARRQKEAGDIQTLKKLYGLPN